MSLMSIGSSGLGGAGLSILLGLGGAGLVKSEGASYTGPLDLVSGAVVAYGQRALSSAKRGTALYSIRRQDNDATQSFSSDATTGAAPSASIVTFLGGNAGSGTIWVDQGASGKDVVQATEAQQPVWTNNAEGTIPAFLFAAGDEQFMSTSSDVTLGNGAYTIFAVLTRTDGSAVCGMEEAGGNYVMLNVGGTPTVLFDAFTDPNEAGGDTDEVSVPGIFLLEVAWEFGTRSVRINGTNINVASSFDAGGPVGSVTAPFAVASRKAEVSATLSGYMFELLVYDTLLSAGDRTAIRQNIATYYGITIS